MKMKSKNSSTFDNGNPKDNIILIVSQLFQLAKQYNLWKKTSGRFSLKLAEEHSQEEQPRPGSTK
jgi:hypothetical protein